MSNNLDPYRVLGVSPDATEQQITQAYRRLAKKYHPDLNPGNAEAEQKMRQINAAYDQIKNIRDGKTNDRAGTQQPGGSRSYGGYNSYGGGYSGAYSALDAAQIYIRTGRYVDALYLLGGINVRSARWFYLSALANDGIGRHIIALEHASQALRMEPANEDYRLLYQQLQAGGTIYQQQRSKSPSMLRETLLWCCVGSTCLSICTRGGVFCPLFCF